MFDKLPSPHASRWSIQDFMNGTGCIMVHMNWCPMSGWYLNYSAWLGFPISWPLAIFDDLPICFTGNCPPVHMLIKGQSHRSCRLGTHGKLCMSGYILLQPRSVSVNNIYYCSFIKMHKKETNDSRNVWMIHWNFVVNLLNLLSLAISEFGIKNKSDSEPICCFFRVNSR